MKFPKTLNLIIQSGILLTVLTFLVQENRWICKVVFNVLVDAIEISENFESDNSIWNFAVRSLASDVRIQRCSTVHNCLVILLFLQFR